MDSRYKDNISRVLKFSLTDGKQRLFGLEYKPIKQLKIDNVGVKVRLHCIYHISASKIIFICKDRYLGCFGSTRNAITSSKILFTDISYDRF